MNTLTAESFNGIVKGKVDLVSAYIQSGMNFEDISEIITTIFDLEEKRLDRGSFEEEARLFLRSLYFADQWQLAASTAQMMFDKNIRTQYLQAIGGTAINKVHGDQASEAFESRFDF